jgi:glucose-6-phosphate 1-dehydrogenase
MAENQHHPFLQGLSKHRGAPPTVVVIFGASGDLTARKLIPAVYNLSHDNLLPADFFLMGFGRSPITDDAFRTVALDAVKQFSRREMQPEVWNRIASHTSYVSGGYDDKKANPYSGLNP